METADQQDLHRYLLGRVHGVGHCVRVHRLFAQVPRDTIQLVKEHGQHVHGRHSYSGSLHWDLPRRLHPEEVAVDT